MKYQKIREEIKKLSDQQRVFKPQRKTKHFTGKRTVPVWKAHDLVDDNRYELRHLFHAYAKAKGIELEPPKRRYLSQSKVDALLKVYFPEVAA